MDYSVGLTPALAVAGAAMIVTLLIIVVVPVFAGAVALPEQTLHRRGARDAHAARETR